MQLSAAERHAIGALILRGVALVGAYRDAIERAVVLIAAVMGARGNGALNAVVCLVVHTNTSFPRRLFVV